MRLRRPTRLKDFDYTSHHVYFITLCTHNKQHLLSQVITSVTDQSDSRIVLSDIGQIVQNGIEYIHNQRVGYSIDHFVIMPNHVHMLIELSGDVEGPDSDLINDQKMKGVLEVVGAMKSYTQSQYVKSLDKKEVFLWQRSFYDQVIRSQKMYESIWTYIEENPLKWAFDEYYGASSED